MDLHYLSDSQVMTAALTLLLAQCLYSLLVVIYRLYFSPLAGFPGPRIAAATGWYEFYYQYWLNGKYIFEIEKMHKKYGPIVRVNPDELSIHDADFYNELYVTENKRRTDHYDSFGKGIGFDDSHFLTKEHDLHRVRRKALEPFFSRLGVTRLQPVISEVALHLESRLREYAGTDQVIRLDHAFTAYAGDIVGRMCLDTKERSDRFLSDPDFSPDWYIDLPQRTPRNLTLAQVQLHANDHTLSASDDFFSVAYLDLELHSRRSTFMALPSRSRIQKRARDNIRKALSGDAINDENVSSLFHHVVTSDMPEEEKSEPRLLKEAQMILAGGSWTSGRTIGVAAYHILSRPHLRAELQKELKEPMATWPQNVPTWAELEKLEVLQAIIKEALRISYGVMHRLPRISPDVPIQYKQYTIPTGIPVGMSSYLMQSDPDVYSSPSEFIPERWIGEVTPAMNRNYVPFAKGSRNCLGIHLAMAEVTYALAALFRPNGPKLELFETDETDVRMVHDFMVATAKVDSKGIRVKVL
ncbi:hypothetical protein JX266_001115 [Neoarthrinium moseri]|nr:hypothetical protein JX266_001115 [Neoarthrinium moseri]